MMEPSIPPLASDDAAAILDRLAEADDLPRLALAEATAHREEMVPIFLREIERALTTDDPDSEDFSALFYIFFLLGQWRETRAYRPLLALLRLPVEELEAQLGEDTLVQAGSRVIAAVFDGDAQPMFDLILDERIDEFIRSVLLEALAMTVLHGSMDRQTAADFLATRFVSRPPEAGNFAWYGWQSTIALLGLTELRDTVEAAFAREDILPIWLSFEDFDEDLQRAAANPQTPWRPSAATRFSLWGDTAEELSSWYGFSEEYKQEQRRRKSHAERIGAASEETYTNPFRHVGRNDPCPCGSGKKFKKCCMGKIAEEFRPLE
jgi:hypothetical protein